MGVLSLSMPPRATGEDIFVLQQHLVTLCLTHQRNPKLNPESQAQTAVPSIGKALSETSPQVPSGANRDHCHVLSLLWV